MSEPDSLRIARAELRARVSRLEAYFQGRRPVPGGFIDPATGRFPEDVERDFACGDIELHWALRLARHALAGNDPEEILLADLHGAEHERNGLILARNYEVVEKKRSGGRKRGAKLREAAADAWSAWETKFQHRIVDKDRAGRLKVRRLMASEMQRAGFVDPTRGEFPSRRTLERHFPAK